MEQPSPTERDPEAVDTKKLVGRVTRIASILFMGVGAVIMATGGDMILGGVLFLIGLVDLVLLPRVLEKVMIQKLQQRQDANKVE